MANLVPTGTEIITVLGVQANGQRAATTEEFTLNQLGLGPTLFGNGTGTMAESGNLYAVSGNPLANPAGITNDYVLAVYSLPASSFNLAGKGIEITASGSLGNDAQVKRVKIIVNATAAIAGSIITGGTTLGDTGAVTAANVGWVLQSQVYKYGAAGSNTQIGQLIDGSYGTTSLGVGLPSAMTANESGAILVAVTGNATTSVGDISLYNINIEGFN